MRKQLSISMVALAVGLLAGCGATPVSQKGAQVELTTEKPKGCTAVGEVMGSQGNVFSGDFTTDQNLMQGARNDMRNRAAELGANVVHIQGSQNSTHPYSAGAVKSTLVGVAFKCPGK